MSKQLIALLLICSLLLLSPVSAEVVTAKVDDKGLMYTQRDGVVGTLHTCYGEIIVSRDDYNNVNINDTIRYNNDLVDYFWGTYWDIEVIK